MKVCKQMASGTAGKPSAGDKVVLQKSIPPQIRQLILHITYSKESVLGFVGDLTYAKTTLKTLCEIEVCKQMAPGTAGKPSARCVYLKQCINQMVLESQLPHEIFNLFF